MESHLRGNSHKLINFQHRTPEGYDFILDLLTSTVCAYLAK